MLKEIYYKIAAILFKRKIGDMGKNTKLRMEGRVLGGQYVHFADGVEIEKGWTIAVYPEFGGLDNPVKLSPEKGVWIGENTSINRNLTVYCADSVKIGKDVLFGSNVLVTDNEHGTDAGSTVSYRNQPLRSKPVQIGDGCWIAENAMILHGTQIGEKSIVAANAVVKGVFPSHCVLAGVPARVVRVWDFDKNEWVRPNSK